LIRSMMWCAILIFLLALNNIYLLVSLTYDY
jgi:hypothetical protein